MRQSSLTALVWFSLVSVASAQTVYGDRFTLKTGPCVMRSGTGSPESAVVGNPCDTWRQTDSPFLIWRKASGVGTTTGWTVNPFGTQTANTGLFGPTSGAAAVPTFRALVLADLPTDSAGKVLISGAAASWSASPSLTSITGAASLTLNPTGDLITDPAGLDVLPDLGYEINLGSLTKKYLTLHAAELWVETLVAQNTIATIGGRILVGPTTPLAEDAAAGVGHIHTKYNNLTTGDVAYLEANGAVEFILITSTASGSSGNYSYTTTRDRDGSGSNDWAAGDAVFNTGQTGNGFMDLYSVRGVRAATEYGPTIVGNVRASSTYNDWSPRWAIGNLDGLYGYSGTTYGAAFGVPSAAWIKIDPTNGVRLGHNTTTLASIGADGSASFAGAVSVGMVTDNLITNAGAEDNATTGWTLVQQSGSCDPFLASTVQVSAGSYSFVINAAQSCGEGARALPVTPGSTYTFRVMLRGAGATGAGLFLRMQEGASSANLSGGFVIDASKTSSTDFVANGPIPATWTLYEYTYTVPAGIHWVTPSVYQWGSTTSLYFDEVEFRKQLRGVHIQDGVITAAKLVTDLVISNTIRSSGATALATGTGFWLDATGTPTFRVGNPAGNQIKWDGTNLTLNQGNAIIDNSGVQILPYASGTAWSDTNSYRWKMANANNAAGMVGYETTYPSVGLYAAASIRDDSANRTAWNRITVVAANAANTTSHRVDLDLVVGYATGFFSFLVDNTEELQVRAGEIAVPHLVVLPGLSTTTGTDLVLDGSNYVAKKSSASRYKEHIVPWDVPDFSPLVPVRFDYLGSGAKGVPGLLAEDVARLCSDCVNYNATGEVESLRTEALLAAALWRVGQLERRMTLWEKRQP